jgi:hypothetical protein
MIIENKNSKKTQTKLYVLGIYQVLGGIAGVGITVWLTTTFTDVNFLLIAIISIALALYAYSIYCGILLLRKSIVALKYSLINQILQFVGFSLFGFAFIYIAGAHFIIGLDFSDSFLFTFKIGLASQWQITINGNKEPLILNFNLVALLLILFIKRLQSKIKDENTERQISSIGEQIEPKGEIFV